MTDKKFIYCLCFFHIRLFSQYIFVISRIPYQITSILFYLVDSVQLSCRIIAGAKIGFGNPVGDPRGLLIFSSFAAAAVNWPLRLNVARTSRTRVCEIRWYLRSKSEQEVYRAFNIAYQIAYKENCLLSYILCP